MKGLIGTALKDTDLELRDSKGKDLLRVDMETLSKRYAKSCNMHIFVLPDGSVIDATGDYDMGHEMFAHDIFAKSNNKRLFQKAVKMCKLAKLRAQELGKDTSFYPYINYPQQLDILIHYCGWIRVFQYANIHGAKPASCIVDFPNPILFGVDYTPEQEKTIKELYIKRNIIKDDEWEEVSAERLKIERESFTDLFTKENVR